MIRSYPQIIGSSFADFDEGRVLALLRDVVIDPETGKIAAFWVKPTDRLFSNQIIQTQDILEWKKKIYVRNPSVLAEPEDLIKVSRILEKGIPVVGQRVRGLSGKGYGRLEAFDFDTQSFLLTRLYAQKRFLGFFLRQAHSFPFLRIVSITPQAILVDDDPAQKQTILLPPVLDLDA